MTHSTGPSELGVQGMQLHPLKKSRSFTAPPGRQKPWLQLAPCVGFIRRNSEQHINLPNGHRNASSAQNSF